MNMHCKLIAATALAVLPFTVMAQSAGTTTDHNFQPVQNAGQTSNGNSAGQDGLRSDYRNSPSNAGTIASSNPPANTQHGFNQPGQITQGQNSPATGNREGARNDYRQGSANGAERDHRASGEQHARDGRQESARRGEERHDGRDRRENRAEHRQDFRQAQNNHRAEQFRHDRDHGQAFNNRHDGGFRNAQQHSFQHRSIAQAGGRRFR